MNLSKVMDEFWRDCEENNFSKEACAFFFYLLYRFLNDRKDEVSINPNAMMSKITGFNSAMTKAASEELQARGYIEHTPASENCTSGKYRLLKTGKKN